MRKFYSLLLTRKIFGAVRVGKNQMCLFSIAPKFILCCLYLDTHWYTFFKADMFGKMAIFHKKNQRNKFLPHFVCSEPKFSPRSSDSAFSLISLPRKREIDVGEDESSWGQFCFWERIGTKNYFTGRDTYLAFCHKCWPDKIRWCEDAEPHLPSGHVGGAKGLEI